jgi:hypothetical protein
MPGIATDGSGRPLWEHEDQFPLPTLRVRYMLAEAIFEHALTGETRRNLPLPSPRMQAGKRARVRI